MVNDSGPQLLFGKSIGTTIATDYSCFFEVDQVTQAEMLAHLLREQLPGIGS
ncbi:hypothetical protein [Erythrobacter donghaensis]|uniref:hypothetical protein n=1 Tax=Erythrobacter donghaensis TaxID=267135 RepID=UPI000AB94A03|nr:hypothetical protein [Erythrobacter donghaensis]